LYPDELRTPLREVRHYTRYVGGFAGNICTGLARLGVNAAIVSRVGDDGHGEFVRAFLESEGVDCRYLSVDSEWGTPPTFCEIWPPDDFPLTFYRHPTAPDWQLQTRHFDPVEIGAAPVLFATGTGLAQSPSRETTLEALLAHQGGTSVFDIDYRPPLWDDPTEFGALAREAAGLADVVVGNREEVAAAGGLDVLLELAPTVILKRGGDGAVLYDDGEAIDVPGVPVDVVNGLGAGDAFGAALGYAIVRGIGLREGLELANRAGAWVAQRIPCSEAMPRLADLSEVGVS
jgi:5-dehydro-2-deoxygluconokinase